MPSLDERIAALAARDRPLAEKILKEAIRIPADYVDRPAEDGGDPLCGLSNHEGPRLEYLRRMVVEVGAVRAPEDVCLRYSRRKNVEANPVPTTTVSKRSVTSYPLFRPGRAQCLQIDRL